MIIYKLFAIIFTLVACHMIGDYVLQTDFIAKSKGENLYHLFVHCILYCVPFALAFGFDCRIGLIFITHFIIDICKAKYNKINYTQDQIFHYLVMTIVYLV